MDNICVTTMAEAGLSGGDKYMQQGRTMYANADRSKEQQLDMGFVDYLVNNNNKFG